MTHEEIQADLPLFVLDTLEPDERAVIEAHLAAGCAACEEQLASWREVVGAMALVGQDAEAADLKPALLERLRSTAPTRKVARETGAPAAATWFRLGAPLAAAAVALLVLAAVRDVSLRGELVEERQQVATLRNEVDAAHGSLQRLTEQLAAKESDLGALRAALAAAQQSLAVVQAPGLRLVHLKEAPQAQPAEGHLLVSSAAKRALFYAFALPAVTPDKAYELWWITEKEGPINAGVFQPDQNGLGRVEATLPDDVGAIQAAAVTVEPAGGLAKPTGPMVLLGAVDS